MLQLHLSDQQFYCWGVHFIWDLNAFAFLLIDNIITKYWNYSLTFVFMGYDFSFQE